MPIRHISFIIALTAVSGLAHAQQYDTLRRKDANGWEFLQIREYNATILEGNLHDNIREGVWTEYYLSGYPSNVSAYRNGKKEGISMQAEVMGRIVVVENYKNDKLEGPRKVYNREGTGLLEETYYSDGEKHGNYTKWHANGKKQETGRYNNGKRDGRSVWYHENGNFLAEYNYKDGVLEGESANFHANGKVSSMGIFKADRQTGLWKEYDEKGNLVAEGNYKDGEKEGAWKTYNETGKVLKTITYAKGIPKN